MFTGTTSKHEKKNIFWFIAAVLLDASKRKNNLVKKTATFPFAKYRLLVQKAKLKYYIRC